MYSEQISNKIFLKKSALIDSYWRPSYPAEAERRFRGSWYLAGGRAAALTWGKPPGGGAWWCQHSQTSGASGNGAAAHYCANGSGRPGTGRGCTWGSETEEPSETGYGWWKNMCEFLRRAVLFWDGFFFWKICDKVSIKGFIFTCWSSMRFCTEVTPHGGIWWQENTLETLLCNDSYFKIPFFFFFLIGSGTT